MNTVIPYRVLWHRDPPTAVGRTRAERRVRTMTRGSHSEGTKVTSRGRRSPVPGRNIGLSSAKQNRNNFNLLQEKNTFLIVSLIQIDIKKTATNNTYHEASPCLG